jgi:S-DNA-T family DNA segregation ATPase FtsK/SpoIIIE
VKLSKITALSNDLSLALAAHPIRIEAPIPGQALVGIEVPNESVAIVRLKEVLASKGFAEKKSNLTLALGRDAAGKPEVADLDKMPHMLIAGATGSGKSVAINSILLALLRQNSPSNLKLILVDPKRVELTAYNGIPHLLTPVVTDPKKTVNALKWTVAEMDRRYGVLSDTGNRDIGSYNQAEKEKLPYIVIVVDELADLMSVAAKDVEAAVVRLAQMARAVGIHLVLATQRPSVDVLTGLIKANITTRMAFKVASQIDSRTILDMSGADKLLGNGDMLYKASDLSKPRRIQGALVSDGEIENVVRFVKDQADEDVEYNEEVLDRPLKRSEGVEAKPEEGDDPLFEEAKEVVTRAGKASASLLQRRLRIGYARAARLLDLMEAKGIIGPADGARPREVLGGGGDTGSVSSGAGGPRPMSDESDVGEPESADDRGEGESEDRSGPEKKQGGVEFDEETGEVLDEKSKKEKGGDDFREIL